MGKNYEKVPKSANNYETILPFSCCPLVFLAQEGSFWGIFGGVVSNLSLRLTPFRPSGPPRDPGQHVTFLCRCGTEIGEETKENKTHQDIKQCQKETFRQKMFKKKTCKMAFISIQSTVRIIIMIMVDCLLFVFFYFFTKLPICFFFFIFLLLFLALP